MPSHAIPATLLDRLTAADAAEARSWWAGLGAAERAEVAEVCDARREACFFAPIPGAAGGRVPRVVGGRFVPHDDAWGLDEWGPGYFQHLLDHPELLPPAEPPRTLHIG